MSSRRRDEQRRIGRRALMRWGLAAGASLGLPRWKVFEVMEATGGKALAQEASCSPTNRSVHIIGGAGGFAWFTLLWPHNDVAAAGNEQFAWHAIGEERLLEGTHRPLTVGPDTPWQELHPTRQVTCLMAGTNESHTQQPVSTTQVAMGTDLFATCAAIQTANPTLTPVIAVDNAPYRDAEGAPRVARVGSADDIVALFNSAASRNGGLLADQRNAELFASSYSAWLQLRAAAGTPTMQDGIAAGTTSARLLGTNLADALRPTDADLARYGIGASSRSQNRELARTLIVTAKAFRHGLTSSVILPAFRDDPHGAFTDMPGLRQTAATLRQTLDAFHADLAAEEDPSCAGTTLADNTVISIHGDTPKTPFRRDNWADGTPANSNWLYVLGAGHLKTGWFGGIDRDRNVTGWNPTTGEAAEMATEATATPAAAAVAYAVAKGDMRRVRDFYRGADIRGIINDPTT